MDTRKLKKISAELKKASNMHRSQARRIDAMLRTVKRATKKRR
tara:strand:- start:883 stop:1011 length:129 start_codon:yes stop_codon:yes gene_type:complete